MNDVPTIDRDSAIVLIGMYVALTLALAAAVTIATAVLRMWLS